MGEDGGAGAGRKDAELGGGQRRAEGRRGISGKGRGTHPTRAARVRPLICQAEVCLGSEEERNEFIADNRHLGQPIAAESSDSERPVNRTRSVQDEEGRGGGGTGGGVGEGRRYSTG